MAAEAKVRLRLEDKTKNAARSAKRNFSDLRGTVLKLTGAVIGLAGAAGLGRLVNSSLQAGDRIQKLAISTGISTEALSEMRHVANITGTEFEQIPKAIIKLQRSFAEARDGMATYADAFEKANINLEEFGKLSPDEQFEVFGEALSRIPDQADRMQVAMDVLGRSGADTIRIFEQGSGTYRRLREEAQELGLTLSRDQVDAMAEANDAIVRLKASGGALGNELAVNLAPVIIDVANALKESLPDGIKFAYDAVDVFQAGLSIFSDTLASILEGLSKWAAWTGQVKLSVELAEISKSLRNTASAYADMANGVDIAIGSTDEYTRSVGEAREAVSGLSENLEHVIDETIQLKEIEVTATRRKIEEVKEATKEADDAMKDFGRDAVESLTDIVFHGGDAKDILLQLIEKFIEMKFASSGGGFFGGGSGGGGIFESIINFGSSILGSIFGGSPGAVNASSVIGIGGAGSPGLIMAASGAEFTVGGSGGTDSQFVPMMLTPGENVTVTPPGKSKGLTVVNHFHITSTTGQIDYESQNQTAIRAANALKRAQRFS